ncbi:S4 domain-containing protein YaaA [Caldalkalibacillus mannanilyticus]|uniref:S4 domain-containing protein YaaA n=1 Tax=Caldalkalibacillus mannanilyticus TaxID=1418 RepID=UPI000467FEE0|nr:S4 domain-containing protein YaaA [Caldalkalibacillus mannanilyticus]
MSNVTINTPYITLGQLIKLVGAVDTGGHVKWFLAEHEIKVNGENENRRGKKLYPGDLIMIEGMGQFQISGDS